MRLFNYLPLVLPVALANPLNVRSTACNNSPDLCDKSYGEITHLGAHDSPFVRTSDSVLAGDQYVFTLNLREIESCTRLVIARSVLTCSNLSCTGTMTLLPS
jgi:hypothetical protein